MNDKVRDLLLAVGMNTVMALTVLTVLAVVEGAPGTWACVVIGMLCGWGKWPWNVS